MIVKNWEQIQSRLPVELLAKLTKSAEGTNYSRLLFGGNGKPPQQLEASKNQQSDLESSSGAESLQSLDDSSNNDSDSENFSFSNMPLAVNGRPPDDTSATDDSCTSGFATSKVQIPFKYQVVIYKIH